MNQVVIAETVRRHVHTVAYWAFVALLVILAFGTARFNTPASIWPTFVAMLAIITGSAPIGPELSSGTLQLILVKPLTRSAYLLSRVAGVVLVVWLAAGAGASAELAGRALLTDTLHARPIGSALLNACASSVLIVALLTLVGSFTRAYFNVGIYLVLQVGIDVAIALVALSKRFPGVVRVLEEIAKNLFPEAPRTIDSRWLLLVLSNAAVALVFACLFFRRREVPYGAD